MSASAQSARREKIIAGFIGEFFPIFTIKRFYYSCQTKPCVFLLRKNAPLSWPNLENIRFDFRWKSHGFLRINRIRRIYYLI